MQQADKHLAHLIGDDLTFRKEGYFVDVAVGVFILKSCRVDVLRDARSGRITEKKTVQDCTNRVYVTLHRDLVSICTHEFLDFDTFFVDLAVVHL